MKGALSSLLSRVYRLAYTGYHLAAGLSAAQYSARNLLLNSKLTTRASIKLTLSGKTSVALRHANTCAGCAVRVFERQLASIAYRLTVSLALTVTVALMTS